MILCARRGPSLFEVVHRLCQRLIAALVAGVEQFDRPGFQQALAGLLRDAAAEGDDTHAWQAAVSLLGSELPALFATWGQPATRDLPIIVISAKELTAEESTRLKNTVSAVVRKQGFEGEKLTAEIKNLLE